MEPNRTPQIKDAATLIAALQALDAGDTSAVPSRQKLKLSAPDYTTASAWLTANKPPSTSPRKNHSIARNARTHTLTLHFPPPLHTAILARVASAITARLAALRARDAVPFAAAANQILHFADFPLGTAAPPGGTTFVDACWRLHGERDVGVALAVVGGGDEKALAETVWDVVAGADRRVRRLVVVVLGSGRAVVWQWRSGGVEGEDGRWRPEKVGGMLSLRSDDDGMEATAGTVGCGEEEALVLPLELFRGTVRSARLEQRDFEPVWEEEIRIPVAELRQTLLEEEERVVRAMKLEDWEMADGDDDTVEDWEVVDTVV